jgi:hypothetical protein
VTPATKATERIAAYIDGFNLYFGIRKEGRRHLWLISRRSCSLFRPHQELVAVRYFTAYVPGGRALEAVGR